jgi:hypothetical protein
MKIVMVVNADLGPGLAANTAAVLGISLGHSDPSIIGPDLYDGSRTCHPGITRRNIPVLAADSPAIKSIYDRSLEMADLEVLGFNTIAHRSRDYEAYAEKLSRAATCDLEFSGLCLRGSKPSVNALTGSLKLYG